MPGEDVMSRLQSRASVLETPLVSSEARTAPAEPRAVRAGTEDRQRVLDLLQEHYVAGRLDSAELEERIERTLAARTLTELDALLADLPSVARPAEQPFGDSTAGERQRPRRGRHRRNEDGGLCGPHDLDALHGRWARGGLVAHAMSYLLVSAMLVAIWLLTTPGGYFWPVWPILGWGIGLASHGLASRSRLDGPPS
jgi:hypothetical protein